MQKNSLPLAISLSLSLIASTASAHDGAPDSFSIAVEQAWETSKKQAVADKRQAAIENARLANQGWFSGTPEVSGRYSSDRLSNDNGNIEYEVEVELPLWLSGQQAAIAASLDANDSVQKVSVQAEKLALAGVVREAYWEVTLKRNNLQLAQRQLSAVKKIASDVQRQIESGVLAIADELLTRAEVLSARAELLSAQQELYAAEQTYLAHTGQALIGHWAVEVQSRLRAVEAHPLLKKSIAEIQAARFKFQRIRIEDRDNTQLSVGWSNERESRDEEYTKRIQIGFKLPFGKDRSNSAELTEAAAERLEAEVHLSELKRTLEAKIVIASAALDTAHLHEESARLKRDIRARRAELDQASFNAGERGLRELLISRSNADEAEQNWQQRRIETARAISALNQALGYLPQEPLGEESK